MPTRIQFIQQSSLGLFSFLLPAIARSEESENDFGGMVLNEDEGEVLQWPDRVTGDGTVRITIKVARINGSQSISFLSESFIPGDRIKIHKHMNEDELIFIHKGSGLLTLGEKEYPVRAGAVAIVPKGVWHGLQNTGTENIEMRFAYTPSGFEEYFRELGTPLGKPFVRRTVEEKRVVGLKYGIIRKADVMPGQ